MAMFLKFGLMGQMEETDIMVGQKSLEGLIKRNIMIGKIRSLLLEKYNQMP